MFRLFGFFGILGFLTWGCHSPATMSAFEAASGKPLQVSAPTSLPAPGFFSSPSVLGTVTLSTGTVGGEIHYTLDGTTPTAISPLYTAPLNLNLTTTLKAVALKSGFPDSPVATGTYFIGAQAPKIAVITYDSTGKKQIIPVTDSYTSAFDIESVGQYYTPISGETYSNLTFHYGYTTNGTVPVINSTATATDLMADGVSFLSGVYTSSTSTSLLSLTGNNAQADIINYASYSGWSDSAPTSTHLQVHYIGNLVVNSGEPVTLNLTVVGNSGNDPVVSAVPYVGSTQIAYNALSQVAWCVNGTKVVAYNGSPSSSSYLFHIKNYTAYPAGTYNITCQVQAASGTYSQSIQGIVYAP